MRSQPVTHESCQTRRRSLVAGCLSARRHALSMTLAASLCGFAASPSLAFAQEPGTAPEVNAPSDAPQGRPRNDALSRIMNQRRGMPDNVVRSMQDPAPAAANPVPAAAASAAPGSRTPTSTVVSPSGMVAPTPAAKAPISVPAPSLLQQPAHRAQVRVGDSGLTVQADNSNLSQVLRDIGSATGMQIEGMGRDERIFGNYGPGAPRDVLASLLYGAGYNVLMVGEIAQGAPRQLILSQRTSTSTTNNTEPPKTNPDEEDAEPDPGEGQDIEAPPVPPPGLPVAPEGSEVRTPQQMLEQLQRMHEDPTPPETQPPQQQQ